MLLEHFILWSSPSWDFYLLTYWAVSFFISFSWENFPIEFELTSPKNASPVSYYSKACYTTTTTTHQTRCCCLTEIANQSWKLIEWIRSVCLSIFVWTAWKSILTCGTLPLTDPVLAGVRCNDDEQLIQVIRLKRDWSTIENGFLIKERKCF